MLWSVPARVVWDDGIIIRLGLSIGAGRQSLYSKVPLLSSASLNIREASGLYQDPCSLFEGRTGIAEKISFFIYTSFRIIFFALSKFQFLGLVHPPSIPSLFLPHSFFLLLRPYRFYIHPLPPSPTIYKTLFLRERHFFAAEAIIAHV